jgi:hypothetical protein
MSAQPQVSPEDQQLSQEVTKDLEAALKPFAEKYKGRVQDLVAVLNWTPEYMARATPKLIVETFRQVNSPDFNPMRQAMELHDLLSSGSSHILKQLVGHLMQVNQQLYAAANPQQEPPGPRLITP